MGNLVYNSGEQSKVPTTLKLELGVFFDGTNNNLKNTKIRKKSEEIEKEKRTPTYQEEQEIEPYITYGKKDEKDEDTSYKNDYTNIARMYMCSNNNSKKGYAVYAEGIGTVNKNKDDSDGYGYGRGERSGIFSKVRRGAEELAKRIYEHKKTQENLNKIPINKIELTIDAFGFSRGATAARNFLHNLTKGAYKAGKKTKNFKERTKSIFGVDNIIYEYFDYNGFKVDKKFLKDEKLPKYGHLGLELLKKGISWDLVNKMKVTVRFLGIYDTVASYDPNCVVFPDFGDYDSELHLFDFNTIQTVHFIALDECRKNFALTHIEKGKGIEKGFPGVHSDIGGSYWCDKIQEEKHILAIDGDLKVLRKKFIEEGWYHDNDEIKNEGGKLVGNRNLKGEYSYLLLNWMSDYASFYIQEHQDENKNWIEKIKYYQIKEKYTCEEKLIKDAKEIIEELTLKSLVSSIGHRAVFRGNTGTLEPEDPNDKEVEWIRGIEKNKDNTLKDLRHEYLHQSAHYKPYKFKGKLNTYQYPMEPAKNRIRPEYPKKENN